MPAILAGAEEAILAKWIIAEGESFSIGQVIAEVETEKALVEIPAEKAGIMGRFLVEVGKPTAVGVPVAVLLSPGENAEVIDAFLASEAFSSVPTKQSTAEMSVSINDQAAPEILVAGAPRADGRTFISPIARKMARENRLDVRTLTGSGMGGRIVRIDIERAIVTSPKWITSKEAKLQSQIAQGTFIDTPHNGMRRAIARRLTESKSTVPHFYITGDLKADEMLNLRKQFNTWTSTKISVTDLLLKTVAAAFGDVPQANAIWTAEAIRQFTDVNISIAVATERGLVTPVVRNVNRMSVVETSTVAKELIDRARTGRLKQDEIEGGTFSITNLGMFGIQSFTAILNPPQSAILAVGTATKKAVVIENQIRIAQVITFTLSVDHRALDGVVAAEWFAAFTKRFENPMWLVVSM
jgi:pyruvate dehydrogenase E2 component (dihydrolipoamide acetyltransferase)